jgi:hypothetical protein
VKQGSCLKGNFFYDMRKFYNVVFCSLVLLAGSAAFGQSVYIPLNQDYYHLVDRYEIRQKDFMPGLHSSIRPFTRKAVAAMADSLEARLGYVSPSDRFNILFLQNDNWEWSGMEGGESKQPVFKHFYRRPSDFWHVQEKDFDFHINPVMHVMVGSDNQQGETPFVNTRGVEIRGMIGKKIGFYSYVADNQARFPFYVQEQIRNTLAVPGEGFWKDYSTNAADFFHARGYITFDVLKDLIDVQFGQDRNIIGNGYRTVFLSDFAAPYLFLKLNTRVWRFQYTNLFAKMTAQYDRQISRHYPVKYFSMHHLSLNLTDNLNIGFFESVTFGSASQQNRGGFIADYLNPMIFYRAVELNLGDNDNVNLGIDAKWNLLGKLQLYGQFLIDDMNIAELRQGRGWFANRFASQLGVKYIDVAGISNLDLQAEFNRVTPYTFSHFNAGKDFSNFQHFNQPLAHPLGANFAEWVGVMRWQPLPRFTVIGKGMYSVAGRDGPGQNWGGDIFKDYTTREQDFGNQFLQGIRTNIYFADLTFSYQVRHQIFIDLKQVVRRFEREDGFNTNNTLFTSLSVRWNMPQRLHEF